MNHRRNIIKSFLLIMVLFIFMSVNIVNAHYLAPEVLENARLATVAILNSDANTQNNSKFTDFNIKGTGIYLGDGYILTAKHVAFISPEIGMMPRIKILTVDFYELEADLVNENEFTDIALYRLKTEDQYNISGKAVFASADPQSGDDVFTTGFPLNWGLTKTFGHLGDANVYMNTVPSRLLQIDMPVCSGNSGSGVFNEKGEVIGLLHAIIQTENVQGLGGCSRFAFAVPVKIFKNIVQSFIAGKSPVFPMLGIEMEMVKRNNRFMIGVKNPKGPALAGGVKSGDILLKINNETISSPAQFKSWLIENVKPGDNVFLRVLRGEKEIAIKIKADKQ